VHNPVGVKIGPSAVADDVVALCERLNAGRLPGRLTLVARLGADRVRELLPPLLRAVRESGIPVLWACDPMHANTFVTSSGHKTRRFDDVLREIEGFFAAITRSAPGPVASTSRSPART
jgi:3-deoxy-7-phosphoheptulonate synthase